MNSFAGYILLDAARMQHHLETAKELNQVHASLYTGRSEEELSDLGPYLFAYDADSAFAGWYKSNGWGDAWGVLIQSAASFEELYEHFRNFLLVKTEGGDELYFRFYDPRVLKTFLPTCNEKQVIDFFGLVENFIVEYDAGSTAMIFHHKGGLLQQEVAVPEKYMEGIFSKARK